MFSSSISTFFKKSKFSNSQLHLKTASLIGDANHQKIQDKKATSMKTKLFDEPSDNSSEYNFFDFL